MKVAVVGSGVSGLAATWALNEFSGHEVHLYEAAPRAGGHAHTASFMQASKDGSGERRVDLIVLTFLQIVFNPVNYPNFLRFLRMYPKLKEAVIPSCMHFSVSRDDGLGEWAFRGLKSIFAHAKNILDRNTWRMIYDILRFNACARRLIMESERNFALGGKESEITIGEYLEREGYSDSFRDNMLIPMMAALYCTPPDICAADFPARTLLQFMENYHLLQTKDDACWMTLRGGRFVVRVYVEHIVSLLDPSRLHVNTPVRSVSTFPVDDPSASRPRFKVLLETAHGKVEEFDHVIMACHTDAALDILRRGKGLTSREAELLGSFRWNKNTAVLHSDARLMPKSPEAWACWNYLTYSVVDPSTNQRKANVDKTSCTFWMNLLQSIPTEEHGHLFVTMNPPYEPEPSKVISRHQYDHAIVDVKGVLAQRKMSEIQNKRGISFAGAWMNYTFHEDGFTSGLNAALQVSELGSEQDAVRLPFEIRGAERQAEPHGLALFFDFMHFSGAQTVIGNSFGFCLDILQALFLFFLFLFSAYEPRLMSALKEPIMSAFATPKAKAH
ncbi:FAD/NAD(P)-binding domain-containing protein [Cytidiella melzeri]|nr:FAD/NAD(P)-binding domain-containing protein [Cytidiella melzeri]